MLLKTIFLQNYKLTIVIIKTIFIALKNNIMIDIEENKNIDILDK